MSPLFVSRFLVSLLLLGSAAQASLLEKVEIPKYLRNKVAQMDIETDLDLFEMSGFDHALSVGANYQYEVSPAMNNGKYLHKDIWEFKVNLNPGDVLSDEENLPVGLGISKGTKVFFTRLFQTQGEALRAIPYTLAKMPFNAEIALKKLKKHDFVAFQANISMVLSKGSDVPLADHLNFNIAASYFVTGEALFHIYKLSDSHLRLKIIGLRGQGTGAAASVGLSPTMEIFGLNYLNKRLNKIFRVNLAETGIGSNSSDLYMIDYVLNLQDSSVAEAYNSFMQATLRLKTSQLANPLKEESKLNSRLLSDLSGFERIFNEDREKDILDRRIDRIFRGKNIGVSNSGRIKIGSRVLKMGRETILSRNKMQTTNRDGSTQNFIYNILSMTKKSQFFIAKEGELNSMSILLTSDEKFKPLKLVDLEFTFEKTDTKMRKLEHRALLRKLNRQLSPGFLKELDIKDWGVVSQKLINVYYRYSLIFTKMALKLLQGISAETVRSRLNDYMKTIHVPANVNSISNAEYNFENTWSEQIGPKFTEDVNKIAEKMEITFDPLKTTDQRLSAFMDLKQIPLFRSIGSGFLVSLIPAEQRESVLAVEFHVGSKSKGPALDLTYGENPNRDLYYAGQYIQAVLNNRSIEMNLLADEESDQYKPTP